MKAVSTGYSVRASCYDNGIGGNNWDIPYFLPMLNYNLTMLNIIFSLFTCLLCHDSVTILLEHDALFRSESDGSGCCLF